jgi:rubrerythrin
MELKDIHIFKKAILNEVEGYEFYKMAAHSAEDPEAKRLFNEMANEERDHLEWLRDVFQKLGGVDEDRFKLSMLEMPQSPGIFTWENVSVKNPSLAVSIFGMAMTFERESVALYESAMAESVDENAKRVFEILLHWEEGHLQRFSKAYEVYSEDWWADQNFHPF